MYIALKVDVDTLRGTREGVPALLDLFHSFGVKATFLFSLGPDHTGRALRRLFRPGFLSKVRRTSVASHYGLKTLLYGTLLPGPIIRKVCAGEMRAAQVAGHEVGIHCHDHVEWQDFVAVRGENWTRRELKRAAEGFEEVFGRPALTHGAAGWQLNPHTLRLEEEFGFRYASDCRGIHPFLPSMEGTVGRCPQLPTTLPTLDELLGRDDFDAENVYTHLLKESRNPLPYGHVFTLHAELEGMQLLPVMVRLLQGWRDAGFTIGPMVKIAEKLNPSALPRHRIEWGEVPGRSGRVAVQGKRLDGTGPIRVSLKVGS